MYKAFAKDFPVISIEDPFDQDDIANCQKLTAEGVCQVTVSPRIDTARPCPTLRCFRHPVKKLPRHYMIQCNALHPRRCANARYQFSPAFPGLAPVLAVPVLATLKPSASASAAWAPAAHAAPLPYGTAVKCSGERRFAVRYRVRSPTEAESQGVRHCNCVQRGRVALMAPAAGRRQRRMFPCSLWELLRWVSKARACWVQLEAHPCAEGRGCPRMRRWWGTTCW